MCLNNKSLREEDKSLKTEVQVSAVPSICNGHWVWFLGMPEKIHDQQLMNCVSLGMVNEFIVHFSFYMYNMA